MRLSSDPFASSGHEGFKALDVQGAARRAATITDPAAAAVDVADWNGTETWSFESGSGLDDSSNDPVRRFHSSSYASSGLYGKGECGQDANGDPYPFECSGFQQDELIAIQAGHVIDANYTGTVYSSVAKANARYHNAVSSNGSGEGCGLTGSGLPNCMVWLFQFTNASNQVVAYGMYGAAQVANGLAEVIVYTTPADFNNGKGAKAKAFNLDGAYLLLSAAFSIQARTKSGNLSDPLAVADPFSVWPADGVSTSSLIKPSDADSTKTNPLRPLHAKSYTSAGMLAAGSCGNSSSGHPLPQKCGGVLEDETVPVGAGANTFNLNYVGTLYGSPSEAVGHLNDSSAAKGSACGLTRNGSPLPNCKLVKTTVSNGGQKEETIYASVAVNNALVEVLATCSYGNFTNSNDLAAIEASFYHVLSDAISAVGT